MITGKLLSENLNLQLSCYPSNLPTTTFGCNGVDGWKWIQFEWATPTTTNGLAITGFTYSKAVDSNTTPPTTDSFKTFLVQYGGELGSYKRIVVPTVYTQTDVNALCASNGTIATVTVPLPIIPSFVGFIPSTAACPAATMTATSADTSALTGTTFTMTPQANDLNGNPLTFSPTSVNGTTLTLLASNAQTAWATLLGTGTFTVSGTQIIVTGTNFTTFAFNITKA